jgi:argininosuccinate synthase
MASAQVAVTGQVRLEFGPGSCRPTGRRAELALYRPDLATYEASDGFDHEAARGFVSLWGLSTKVWASVQREHGL